MQPMEPLTFDPVSYRIRGEPVYLYSGEMHYFRVPRADWRRRMALFKEAGGNCLATYIPWLLHEPEEGSFHFGETAEWLDLEGFLQTAQEAGLYVIARPGPYQYSELIYDGLPGWLCENYPEIRARDIHGRAFRKSSVSYLHPLFLEKAMRWFAVVCPILSRYTLAQGGPIAFVQLDNELAGIHEWFGSLDYHPETMGFGKDDGRYPRFLRQRYEHIDVLNRLYESHYAGFAEVAPPAMKGGGSLAEVRRQRDYFEFYLDTIAEFMETLAAIIRSYGIEVPLLHNSANPGMNAYFQAAVERLGEGFLLGSDHYYNLDQNWAQNNPTPQYAARVFLSNEMLRLMGFPPTVLELPGGSAADWPPLTPEDARACYFTNLALGMKGHNFYIFTGGPNPPGAGATTDLYDYGAAIAADGQVRPLYEVQKELGNFIQAHPWWLTAKQVDDCRLALDFDQARLSRYLTRLEPGYVSPGEAWEFLRGGALTTALCASLSPQLCDLGNEDWLQETATPVIACSASSMSRSKQERLTRFVERGGRLLLAPTLPELDERYEPCTRLRDFIGLKGLTAAGETLCRPGFGGLKNVQAKTWWLEGLPADAQVLGIDERSGRPLACQLARGKGSVIVLGLSWLHARREHESLLRFLLQALGWQQKVRNSNPNVWTALWQSEAGSVLFVMNLLTAAMSAEISFQGLKGWIQAGAASLPPISVKTLVFDSNDQRIE